MLRQAQHEGGSVFPVWWENWPAVCLFLACQTQWRFQVAGARVLWQGLDYPAVRAAAAMLDQVMTPALFDDLRVMEGAALEALNRT